MNRARAYWISITIFGLVVLFEASYTIRTDGLTRWAGVRVLGGVLIVGPVLWQGIVPEQDIGGMDTGWWTYAAIIGTISYIIGVVLKML